MNLRFLPGKDLPHDTPLWRYVSFGAFFLLLQRNEIFVPSLKKLQEADPKEMLIRRHSLAGTIDWFVHSDPFQKAREWLKQKYRSRTGFDLDPWCPDPSMQNPFLVDEWIGQLSV